MMKTIRAERFAGRISRCADRLAWQMGFVLLLSIMLVGSVYADDVEFTNDTMETRVTSPPPNIMFVLDNSGSMDWSVMAPESSGKFHGDSYLWYTADNHFKPGETHGDITYVREWKARWSGYNRLFYRPSTSYVPWPRWNQSPNTDGREINEGEAPLKIKNNGLYPPFYADLNTPRSNPVEWEKNPLSLHDPFMTIEKENSNAIIVDNADGSSRYGDNFDETTSNRKPYWGDNYRWTDNTSGWARFTPNLAEKKKYTIWAYWPCNDNSDEQVEIELKVDDEIVDTDLKSQKANLDDVGKAGICGEWISLFNGTLHELPAGTGTELFLYRKGDSKNSYTYADAVAFLPEGETEVATQIRNAHYYMVDDKNDDGEPQEGEVYLVNFEWDDIDNDDKVDKDEVSRRYYLVSYDDDSGNHEDVTSLEEVEDYKPDAEYDADGNGKADEADSVPDSIQPITYNDTLKKYVFVSDRNDLQNFANWFSFYRRRELTAKAAVSRTIAELDNVYVGYNTMHRVFENQYGLQGGAKQPVLPIDVYESIMSGDAELTVDNKDSGLSKSGKFSYEKRELVTRTVVKWVNPKTVPKFTKNYKYRDWEDKSICKTYAKEVRGKSTNSQQNQYCKEQGNEYKEKTTVEETDWETSQVEVDSWIEVSKDLDHGTSSLETQDHDLSSDPDKWAKFTPNIQEAGSYKVSAWWPCYADADTKAQITIEHEFGTTTKYYNQKASSDDTVSRGNCTSSSGTGCCGHWVELGQYDFEEGQDGYVEIRRDSGSTGSLTAADAVRFEMEGILNTDKVNQLDTLLDILYQVSSNGGTPLRKTLQDVGEYYDDEDSSNGGVGECPYLSVDQGGACQQSYAIAMTDGFWNGGSPDVGNKDQGKGSPYADDYSNTLADVAMRYYDTDLVKALPDEMATNDYDKQKTQHMVTFGVSFGLDGTIDPNDIDGYADDPYFLNTDTEHPEWPEPKSDKASTIDDLWHATVNGRGRYFSAKNPDALVEALHETFADISNRKASGSSVSVNGDELSTGLILYQSTYKSGDWEGNVSAYPVDPATGEIHRSECQFPGDDECVLWRAQKILEGQDWDTGRNIFTFDGSMGIPFRYDELDKAQQDALSLENKGGQEVVNFLRGGPSEVEIEVEVDDPDNPGEKKKEKEIVRWFRDREVKLGDLVHSAPLLVSALNPEKDGIDNDEDGVVDEGEVMNYARLFDEKDNDGDGEVDEMDEKHDGIDNDGDGVIDEEEPQETGGTLFAGGNDGMLHAFNAETGTERFAYVPLRSFDYLFDLTKDDYEHRYYVDGRQSFKRLRFLAGDQTGDYKDNDGDGIVDEFGPVSAGGENYSDNVDNDGDGIKDEPFEYKTLTLLVGTLNKGGRGIYALDISNAESITARSGEELTAQSMVMWEYPPVGPDGMEYSHVGQENKDGFDNDGDGAIDEEGEMALMNLAPATDDSLDNDNDGEVDEAGELKPEQLDSDMGYSYGDAFVARSYLTTNEAYDKSNHPWVVIFGNGYQSRNGQAVLYIVDALTGKLIRKIATGPSGNNGLSSPAVVDIDNDDRVDFVYAGDLTGNMWKFDLRDPEPENWGVIYGTDAGNPAKVDKNNQSVARIDYNDVNGNGERDDPKPLINVGRPITTAPDVAYHCEEHGYIVVFGTGKFLGGNDVSDRSQQGIFGIWDFGDNPKDYLGNWKSSDNSFPDPGRAELKKVQLLDQVEIDWRKYYGSYLRTLSDKKPQWSASDLCYNDIDDDGDLIKDNESCVPSSGHVGWYFDLPYHLGLDGLDNDSDGEVDEDDESAVLAGERVVKDVLIRYGNAVVISLIPGDSPCDGGGNSIVHEMPFCTGGRLTESVFDINNDGVIDEDDVLLDENGKPILIRDENGNPIYLTDENGDTIVDENGNPIPLPISPNGRMYDGILHKPVVIGDPDEEKKRELKIFSSSAGTTEVMWEKKEKIGFYYWKEH